jgi:hypothetical protein
MLGRCSRLLARGAAAAFRVGASPGAWAALSMAMATIPSVAAQEVKAEAELLNLKRFVTICWHGGDGERSCEIPLSEGQTVKDVKLAAISKLRIPELAESVALRREKVVHKQWITLDDNRRVQDANLAHGDRLVVGQALKALPPDTFFLNVVSAGAEGEPVTTVMKVRAGGAVLDELMERLGGFLVKDEDLSLSSSQTAVMSSWNIERGALYTVVGGKQPLPRPSKGELIEAMTADKVTYQYGPLEPDLRFTKAGFAEGQLLPFDAVFLGTLRPGICLAVDVKSAIHLADAREMYGKTIFVKKYFAPKGRVPITKTKTEEWPAVTLVAESLIPVLATVGYVAPDAEEYCRKENIGIIKAVDRGDGYGRRLQFVYKPPVPATST